MTYLFTKKGCTACEKIKDEVDLDAKQSLAGSYVGR